MATIIIGAGETASGSNVLAGDRVIVEAGGQANGLRVTQGGSVTVSSGGVASALSLDVTIRYGSGSATILSGGMAYDTVAKATLTVDGGTTVGTTTPDSGVEIVKNGGRTTGTIGRQIVADGGTSVGTWAGNFYSAQAVLYGGVAIGTVVTRTNRQEVAAGGTAVSTIVQSGATQVVAAGGTARNTVVDPGGVLKIEPGASVEGTTLHPGGIIQLLALPYADAGQADYDPQSMTLSVVEGGLRHEQTLSGDYAGEFFHLSDDGAGGTFVTVDGTPCYCHGTHILTDRGEVPVEDLDIGDTVIARSGPRPIRWLGRRSYAGRYARGNRDILPVTIRAGALGGGLPRRDLSVSPLHALVLDGVLVPASSLVNGETIVQAEAVERVEYVHIELDTHDVILAEGAPSETFIDDHSRGMFHNAAEFRLLYPDAPRPEARYCLPRVEDGERLAAIRRRLAPRPERRAS